MKTIIFKNTILDTWIGISIFAMLALFTQSGLAFESYSATITSSQWFDLETGALFGVTEDDEQELEITDELQLAFVEVDVECEDLLEGIDVEFEGDLRINRENDEEIFTLFTDGLLKVAFVDYLSFDTITEEHLSNLYFDEMLPEIEFTPTLTLIALTSEGNIFKLGNFLSKNNIVSFDYQQMVEQNVPVPEPGTIVLVGLGLVGIGIGMKRKFEKLCVLLVGAFVFLSVLSIAPPAHALLRSKTGFYYPTNSTWRSPSQGGYIGWLGYNKKYPKKPWHLGVDFKHPVGTSVYAISDGKVVYVNTLAGGYGCNGKRGGAMAVMHQTKDGKPFIATYGHVKDMAKQGRAVKAGEKIAAVGKCDNIPHLHFAIRPGTTISLKGYSESRTNYYGFVDPLRFLEAQSPLNGSSVPPVLPKKYQVTINKSGTGGGVVQGNGIDCGTDCTESYTSGSLLNLKAIPDNNSDFSGWMSNGVPISKSLPISSDQTLTAVFTLRTVSIRGIATGNATLPIVRYPQTITNGDFGVYADSANPIYQVVGDGVDEGTKWVLDFTTDSRYTIFSTSPSISSAILTLTLATTKSDAATDGVRISGLPFIITPIIQSIPAGVSRTIEINLLDFYQASDILNLLARNAGKLWMLYEDDAIISNATLELKQ